MPNPRNKQLYALLRHQAPSARPKHNDANFLRYVYQADREAELYCRA